jgi:hypothetical protein
MRCQPQMSGSMNPPSALAAPPKRRWPRRLGISTAVLLVLLGVGWFAGRAWLDGYLRGPEFRRFLEKRVGDTLKAEADLAPLAFTGLNVYTDGLTAQGFEGAPFAHAGAENVRMKFSLRRFFDRVWQVDDVQIERVAVRLDGTRLSRPPTPQEPPRAPRSGPGWLPNRLEIASALVREVNLDWGDTPSTAGGLHRVELRASFQEKSWELQGRGGTLTTPGMPSLDLVETRLRQKERQLFIQSASFNAHGGGTISATGEVDFDNEVDVLAKLDGIDIQPLLPEDWRARLHGHASGEVRVQSALPVKGPVTVSGTIKLRDGRLEALPVLNQIAAFTRTQQFRQMPLSEASAEFRRDKDSFSVSQLVAESIGLMRIEGGFRVIHGEIDGTFQVGVAPATLQWIPGSQERVFTVARGSYLWTTMRLTGPVDSPKEDLSGRLATAAGDAIVDKVENTARDVFRAGKDAAQGALDWLMPRAK